MLKSIERFELIVRKAHRYTEASMQNGYSHPFDARNIHRDLQPIVRSLFDNGHYAQASFEAYKYVDEEVQRISGEAESGTKLMMKVFGGSSPRLRVNGGTSKTDLDEQNGYKFLFAGGMLAIRNPRGHTTALKDNPDLCLDHLSFASMLLRKLDEAGLRK